MPKKTPTTAVETSFGQNKKTLRHRKKLLTLEENCDFKDIKHEDLLLSKLITNTTDTKLREKFIREKTLDLKTTVDLVTQNSYDHRHK